MIEKINQEKMMYVIRLHKKLIQQEKAICKKIIYDLESAPKLETNHYFFSNCNIVCKALQMFKHWRVSIQDKFLVEITDMIFMVASLMNWFSKVKFYLINDAALRFATSHLKPFSWYLHLLWTIIARNDFRLTWVAQNLLKIS